MPKARVSTTVDAELLDEVRRVRRGVNDAALLEEAFRALLSRYRSAAIDLAYANYDESPMEAADEWGDLASFRAAASKT